MVLSLSFSFGACTWLLQYKDDYIAVSPVQTSLKPQTRGQLIRVVQSTCNHVEASTRSRSCLHILARPAVFASCARASAAGGSAQMTIEQLYSSTL